MLQQLGYEVTILTLNWIDIYRRRHTSTDFNRQHTLTPSPSLLISLPQPTSWMSHAVTPPQPATSAWLHGVFSAFLWWRLCTFTQDCVVDLCTVLIQTTCASLASNNTSQPCCSHFFGGSFTVCFLPALPTLHNSYVHITPPTIRDLIASVGQKTVVLLFFEKNTCRQNPSQELIMELDVQPESSQSVNSPCITTGSIQCSAGRGTRLETCLRRSSQT